MIIFLCDKFFFSFSFISVLPDWNINYKTEKKGLIVITSLADDTNTKFQENQPWEHAESCFHASQQASKEQNPCNASLHYTNNSLTTNRFDVTLSMSCNCAVALSFSSVWRCNNNLCCRITGKLKWDNAYIKSSACHTIKAWEIVPIVIIIIIINKFSSISFGE